MSLLLSAPSGAELIVLLSLIVLIALFIGSYVFVYRLGIRAGRLREKLEQLEKRSN